MSLWQISPDLTLRQSLRKVSYSVILSISKSNYLLTILVGLRQLILLNTLLYGQEDIKRSIAKQRLVFFAKHLIPWLASSDVTLLIRAEVCRALTALLPIMGDIYGEHWGDILNALAVTWGETSELGESESVVDRYVSSLLLVRFFHEFYSNSLIAEYRSSMHH
jgi:hypothetical protein